MISGFLLSRVEAFSVVPYLNHILGFLDEEFSLTGVLLLLFTASKLVGSFFP